MIVLNVNLQRLNHIWSKKDKDNTREWNIIMVMSGDNNDF